VVRLEVEIGPVFHIKDRDSDRVIVITVDAVNAQPDF
jgi:hypothetical protein